MPCEQVPLQDPAVIIKLLPDGLDEVEQILRLSDIFAVGHLHGVFRHVVQFQKMAVAGDLMLGTVGIVKAQRVQDAHRITIAGYLQQQALLRGFQNDVGRAAVLTEQSVHRPAQAVAGRHDSQRQGAQLHQVNAFLLVAGQHRLPIVREIFLQQDLVQDTVKAFPSQKLHLQVGDLGDIEAYHQVDLVCLQFGQKLVGHPFPQVEGDVLMGRVVTAPDPREEDVASLVRNAQCKAPGGGFGELGNAGGIGAYEVAGFTNALTDDEYLELVRPYLGKGNHIGMFLNATRHRPGNDVPKAAKAGLDFLRVGCEPGRGEIAVPAIKEIKANGMKAFYSAMKAYLVTPEELAEEALMLEEAGLDEYTIMDSAGCMTPEQVAEYTRALVKVLHIPVAFHCHNNLGLSAANALAAYQNGAQILDCGLMGMARSAGNLATEVCTALMQKYGEFRHIDFYGMLNGINDRLLPAMEQHNFHDPITPFDLILGVSGAHSSFSKTFKKVAAEQNVSVYQLIVEVSKIDRRKPTEELMRTVAQTLPKQNG